MSDNACDTTFMNAQPSALVPVKVAYTIERTVYVYADSPAEARRNAKDTANWADEDEPNPLMDSIRVLRDQG